MIQTYILTSNAKKTRWSAWKKIGGCGLSTFAEIEVRQHFFLRKTRLEDADPTLGEIGEISVKAEREIARFGETNLDLPDWAFPEYRG